MQNLSTKVLLTFKSALSTRYRAVAAYKSKIKSLEDQEGETENDNKEEKAPPLLQKVLT